jgi:hypothetical protein
MVESARLSHGVFSTRYGHTISGLLEVTSRKPSPTETELEVGLSSSAANMNLSFPLGGKGGVMVMGKVTYWDPFVALMKLFLEEARFVTGAPYIRSGAFAGNYRFTNTFELSMNGFIGGDGVGASYKNESEGLGGGTNKTDIHFNYGNTLGFFLTGITWNPLPSMVLKANGGIGFGLSEIDGGIYNQVTVFQYPQGMYPIDQDQLVSEDNLSSQYQGRVDLDWDVGKGFLLAFGVQELYSQWNLEDYQKGISEVRVNSSDATVGGMPIPGSDFVDYVNLPIEISYDVENKGLTTSAYTLLEYKSPQQRFGFEAGVRLDHLYFMGRDFTIQTLPILNPRLNLDFTLLSGKGVFDSITATVGSGFFSSMTDNIAFIQSSNGIDDLEMKQNRAWTSVVGTKLDFVGGYSFNIEGYYKYVFNNAYTTTINDLDEGTRSPDFLFDGEGRVWGFDFMLQKLTSRFWDGWLSYTFTYARYRRPQSTIYTKDWYYPSFHRFHNMNIVLNLKPWKHVNIALRLGLASGQMELIPGAIEEYQVAMFDNDLNPVLDEDGLPVIIKKYRRSSTYDENSRTPWSIPIDVKFSFYFFNRKGKGQGEFYVAAENLASLFYKPLRGSTFNSYTGEVNSGSNMATYDMPFPMPSIGFTWRY